MTAISQSCHWRNVAGNFSSKFQETIEERLNLFGHFRSSSKSNLQEISQHGKKITKECHVTLPWRPATLVTLDDTKGQAVMKTLGLIIEGAYLVAARSMPIYQDWDEQLILNSLNNQYHSLYGQSIDFFWKTVESISLVLRAIYLLGLFTPCFIIGPLADLFGGQLRLYWLDMLLSRLERAGPAFIKWGQWAATRPDVCESLSKLHMQAPSHSFQQTRRICEKAFEAKLEDIFEEFLEDPIASGSIAQVHRAVLKGQDSTNKTPKYVAVKVRHPGVNKIIQRDFVIIKWLAHVSAILPGLQHLQLDKTVQQFASFMTKQVDLTLEAAHLLRFSYNFRKIHNIAFPAPIYPLVHPSVLVETYEEGESIANFVEVATNVTRAHSQLAYIGSSALLKMLLRDNFIHGDLHPGNIYVRFTGNHPNIVLLDVGMTAELQQRHRNILLQLFKGIAEKDGLKVAKATLMFSKDQTCPNPEGFKRDVDANFKEYLKQRGTPQNTGECMNRLFDQVRKHRVHMDGDVCTVMVTTLVLEGWQRKLDPHLDIIKMVGDLLFKEDWAIPYDYLLIAHAAP
ncbi:unnamed protein product [Calypogeia fissa]